jgi:uncharacterized repeat protein (TIGR03803 family)
MKRIFTLLTLLLPLFIGKMNAQIEELWGSSQFGGDSIGNIFKINTDGTGSGVAHNFEYYSGRNPLENNLLQINGKFYGTTFEGGNSDGGMLFSFDTLTHTFASVFEFTMPYGEYPSGLLVRGAGNLFYGVCHGGGYYHMGTLYSFDVVTHVLTVLKNFDMTNSGGGPQGLVLASNGKLYGSTLRGGFSDQGVLWSYDIGLSSFTTLMGFTGSQGYDPVGYLVESNNKLFGYTWGNHPNDFNGRIFCWDIGTSSFSLVSTFSNSTLEGGGPCRGMMVASNGKVYGTVQSGGANGAGIIFSIDPFSNTYTNEHDFTAAEGAMYYVHHFVESTPGILYGYSLTGGSNSSGYYYSYNINTHALSNVYNMASSTVDGNGVSGFNKFGNKIYTVYQNGGTNNIGTIACTNLNTGVQTKYYDFENFSEGWRPQTSLIKCSNNKVYGTTYIGGRNGYGTVFSINLCSNAYTRIYDFDYYPDGRYPEGKLVQAANGKLYGLTQSGATSNWGCLFSIDTATNAFTKLYDFATGNMQMPSSLVYNPNDNKIYGVVMSNVTSNPLMFSWNIATSTFTSLASFTGTPGFNDFFKMGPGNKMYCFTETGGTANDGRILVYDPVANTVSTLYSFGGAVGTDPKGTPCISPAGMIYGTTYAGGTLGNGVVFSYNIATNTYTDLYNFPVSSALGNFPKGQPYLSTNGKLYGTTSEGPHGSIFQFDLSTNQYTDLHNFTGLDGDDPIGELVSVGNAPAVSASSYIVCPASMVTLTASGGTSYLWQPGNLTGSSVSVTVNSSTTYSVAITLANGCVSNGSVTVGVMEGSAGADQYLCSSGGSTQLIAQPAGINTSNFNSTNWVHTHGSTLNDDGPVAVVTDPAGNVYTVGSFKGTITLGTFTLTSSGASDIYLAKMDSSGTFLWAVTNSSANTANDYGSGIKLDNAGNIYICGHAIQPTFGSITAATYYGGNDDGFAAKFNNNGVCQWITEVGGWQDDQAYAIDVDRNSGAVYITGAYKSLGTFGSFTATATGFSDYYLLKMNGSTGVPVWFKTIAGANNYEYGVDVHVDHYGNIYTIGQGGGASMDFGGYIYSSLGPTDFFLAKYNSSGVVQWVTGGGGSYVAPASMAMDYNNCLYVTGYFTGANQFGSYSFTSQSGTADFFGAKYNSSGVLQWIRTGTGAGADEGQHVAVSPNGTSVLFTSYLGNNCNFGSGYIATFPSATLSTCLLTTDTLGNYQWLYTNFSNAIRSYANYDNTGSHIYGAGIFTGSGNVGAVPITSVSGSQDILYYKFGLANPITYNWAPSAGLNATTIPNPVATPTVTTTYTVSINNGTCNVSDQVTVYAAASASVSPNVSICLGSSTVLTATGGVNYSWSPATGLNATNISNPVAAPSVTTTYSVMITSGSCVSNLQVVVLIDNPTVTASAASSTICAGQSTTLSATGGTSYNWQPGNLSGSSISVSPSAATTYTVIGTDAAGCQDTTTKTISVNPLPVISASTTNNTVCSGTPAVINSSGGNTYQWQPGNLTGNSITVTPGNTTTYSVTGTDLNGCQNTAQQTITVNPLPNMAATATLNPICVGTSTTLDATGAANYTWQPGNINNTSVTITPSSTVTYTLTGTDGNNCTGTTTLTVTVSPIPVVNVNATNNVICSGSSATLTATGANSFSWQPGNLSGASVTVNPASNTTYTVTGSNPGGCSDSATQFISVNALPVVTFSLSATNHCTTDPSFTLTGGNPSGGSYSGTGVTAGNFNPSVAGTGTFTITYSYTDGNSCTNTATQQVVVNPCTGIQLQENLSGIDFYPNPTDGTISFQGGISAAINVQVLDAVGQVILEQKISPDSKTIDISSLANGVYFLQWNYEGSIFTKKIVKEY